MREGEREREEPGKGVSTLLAYSSSVTSRAVLARLETTLMLYSRIAYRQMPDHVNLFCTIRHTLAAPSVHVNARQWQREGRDMCKLFTSFVVDM